MSSDPFQERDPYEEADKAARREAIGDTTWQLITEVGRATKTPEHACPTKNEIAEAMGRNHGFYSDIGYHLRKAIKKGLVTTVGVSMSNGNTYGLTVAGSRLVGFSCETYTSDGPNDSLDLSRTKAALEAFDKLDAEYDATVDGMENEEALAFLNRIEAAAKAVGEAFADDTKDRNPRDAALLVRPGAWIRRLVEKYGAS